MCPHVVSIVSGGYNQFSSARLYEVFESLYRCLVWLVSLFNGISILCRLFNANVILVTHSSYLSQGYLPESDRNSATGIRTRFNHYTTRTPPCIDAFTLSLMLANYLHPSFLETYSLSISSVGCKALL